jgi:ATPase subunit of ABC transporter with duplicated ATPase domains
MLKADGLTVYRGHRLILDDVSFTLGKGRKAALVGVNGVGKSTLQKTIVGLLEPDKGQVSTPERVGYMPQEIMMDVSLPVEGTVAEYVLSSLNGYHNLKRSIDRTLDQMALARGGELDELVQKFGGLEDRFNSAGYYVVEHEAQRLMAHIGLAGIELDRSMHTLSGGQKTHLALARLLLSKPDLLLLDEPTNFLDVEATAWFMGFLAGYEGSVLIVSHDVGVLDASIDKVLHLNEFTKRIDEYTGTFSDYKAQHAQRKQVAQQTFKRKQKEIRRLQERSDWLMGGGRSKGMHRRGRAMSRRVERLEESLPDLPRRSREIMLRFPLSKTSGREVLQVAGLRKGYNGTPVFSDLELTVERGERVIIVGLNGTGKTTLLRIVAGLLQPDEGSATLGHNVDMGYYAQEYDLLDFERSVLQELRSAGAGLGEKRLRSILGGFLFPGDCVEQKTAHLSGGEKTRLSLAKLVVGGHNLLLLDEPTTYLDDASQAVLLVALREYEGTLIVVSHNAGFVSDLQPDTALIMPDGLAVPYDNDLLDLVELA